MGEKGDKGKMVMRGRGTGDAGGRERGRGNGEKRG